MCTNILITTTADIDAKSYMDHVGNHLALGQQKMFQIFFNGVSRTNKKITLADIKQHGVSNGNEIELSHTQFVALFYKGIPQNSTTYDEADAAQLNAYQYKLNTDSPDYWQRSFVFGSTKMKLDTNNIKYIFDYTYLAEAKYTDFSRYNVC